MVIMTDGLRTLAGSAIRQVLLRFTRTPLSGAMTGAVGTAILQSSSATTVAAVGFVGAGLMAFPEALGIVFGANIGTTLKGWLIALLGFKFQLGNIVLPIIFAGISLRLFTKGRVAATGYVIAGFGVIFLGITIMQGGVAGLEGVVTPDILPSDTWLGRLQLVAIGILITLITQSSSAGVAAALTALYAGNINFQQAAALVIGMDVGTTVTALMATIGGSVGARRTGYSHVIYNLMTAVFALILITPFTLTWEAFSEGSLVRNAEIALVAFHTSFNTLGAIIILPFTRHFAHLVERLVPEKLPSYMKKLDIQLVENPGLALTQVQHAVAQQIRVLLIHLQSILMENGKGKRVNLHELQAAIDDVHVFIDEINLRDEESAEWERLIQLIHALDHMQRLHERCEEEEYRAEIARVEVDLQDTKSLLLKGIQILLNSLDDQDWSKGVKEISKVVAEIEESYGAFRQEIVKRVGRGDLDVEHATRLLESRRWLLRVSRHLSQIDKHFSAATLAAGSHG
jgi:phosphate:Na+ symporter